MSSNIYAGFGASYARSFYTDVFNVERSRSFDNQYSTNATIGWRIDNDWELGAQFVAMGGNAYAPLNDSASKARAMEVFVSDQYMKAHLPGYFTFNARVDKRFHFQQSSITLYLTLLNALNIHNTKTIEWNPYSKSIVTTKHIGLLPVLGVEWQL